CLQDIQFPLSF
nr:immunoglobulin light chain junction region [Macaca mulatta]MOW62935.1 immunoglobulin light chain junction region [Macaca mulatta]MOW63561.1 immunoglobulin light chain junction region [Macaca mulatta]MOW64221.1 immunoglobulin light chain junction region [Macaca mulatta]MOW65469.1 immunoglobulin light chain junction region [Macaca mulatta]